MDNYNQSQSDVALAQYTSQIMKSVYVKMFLGLLVTAATAWVVAGSDGIMSFMRNNSWVYWVLLIAEIGLVFTISGAINKLSEVTAALLFYLYSLINGVVFSVILLAYTGESILSTFLITAGVFGAMSVYGYFTSSDLTKIGTFLRMALIGLIICIVVNLFLGSSKLEWIISFAGVAIFIGLTAWDTQKIKKMAAETDPSFAGKLSTIGALTLYLDFINLFIYLLRFFGNSRD